MTQPLRVCVCFTLDVVSVCADESITYLHLHSLAHTRSLGGQQEHCRVYSMVSQTHIVAAAVVSLAGGAAAQTASCVVSAPSNREFFRCNRLMTQAAFGLSQRAFVECVEGRDGMSTCRSINGCGGTQWEGCNHLSHRPPRLTHLCRDPKRQNRTRHTNRQTTLERKDAAPTALPLSVPFHIVELYLRALVTRGEGGCVEGATRQ